MGEGLCRPGENGVEEAHGHAGSTFGQSIYVSPSIEHAAHPVYASFVQVGVNHWVQLVLQCRVRPTAVREQASTLWQKHWPQHTQMDPNFPSMRGLEWLVC